MTELHFWCVLATGIFIGLVFGAAAYACYFAPVPRRNYGLPERHNLVELDSFRRKRRAF